MQTYINCRSTSFPWISYIPSTLLPTPPVLQKQVKTIPTLVTRRTQTSPFSSTVGAQRTTTISDTTSSTEVLVKSEEKDIFDMAGLRRDRMPEHLAIILDGNRRWFKVRGLQLDYDPFFKSNMLVADLCLKWGIPTTTSFVYALENMRRSQETTELIFRQFEKFLVENLENFIRKSVKVSVIGESSMYPQSLKDVIKQVEEATTDFSKLELMFAVCYGGTRDVMQAVRNICTNVKDGNLELKDVNEALVKQELYTKNSRNPNVDLFIRTGGHLRLSNFLMWQIAEAELYFTNSDTMAPNFGEHVFLDALRSFQHRDRTFGK